MLRAAFSRSSVFKGLLPSVRRFASSSAKVNLGGFVNNAAPKPSTVSAEELAAAKKFGWITFGLISAAAFAGVTYQCKGDYKGFYKSLQDQYHSTIRQYSEPSRPYALLPSMQIPPGQKMPLTLVLDLNETLVHTTWSRERGYQTKKRPGVDYFLAYLSQFYELVIFTSNQAAQAQKIIETLDPNRYVHYHLFRDSTCYVKSKHVKDLNHLNRDLRKVMIVHNDKNSLVSPKENILPIPRWTGQPGDNELVNHMPFLESLAIAQVDDVRPVLASYGGTNVGDNFNRRLKEYREKKAKKPEVAATAAAQKAARGSSGLVSMVKGFL
eukprot:TRINITY_DN26053_c0_g1_i2.p1 TRINITY_DN26053_c0_g1~~TRINITY_DN26053_c0_g1_i2.p1  ORF type:complete len:325 (-),score=65.36 TRINITY_DN26053_c0_g1_i2:16-990(-)